MSEVAPVNGALIQQPVVSRYGQANSSTTVPASEAVDAVEISSAARAMSLLDNAVDLRMERIAQIREAIARGDYETPEKIEYVVGRLLEELSG